MVNSETLNYIELLKNKQYFDRETNIENFILLIQNKFCQIVGQILVSESK